MVHNMIQFHQIEIFFHFLRCGMQLFWNAIQLPYMATKVPIPITSLSLNLSFMMPMLLFGKSSGKQEVEECSIG